MKYWQHIQRGIEFVENNLNQNIELNDVAKAAGLSRWHFQRIFKAVTQETLKSYIRNRRLSCSMVALSSPKQRIIDIAMGAGFESQEAYTRAFKNLFGVTPNQYRNLESKKQWLHKPKINQDYLSQLSINGEFECEIVTRPEMWLAGLYTQFHSVDSEKNNIADSLPQLWEEFIPRMSEIQGAQPANLAYGVIKPTSEESDLLEYYAAVQIEPDCNLPPGFTKVHIPEAKYAIFTHFGRAKGLNQTVDYIYSSWLFNHAVQHTLGPDLEIYGPKYRPDTEQSEIQYAIPIYNVNQ